MLFLTKSSVAGSPGALEGEFLCNYRRHSVVPAGEHGTVMSKQSRRSLQKQLRAFCARSLVREERVDVFLCARRPNNVSPPLVKLVVAVLATSDQLGHGSMLEKKSPQQ